jgi:hypothetical protein
VVISLTPMVPLSGRVVAEDGQLPKERPIVRFRRVARLPTIPDPPPSSVSTDGSFTAQGFIDGDYAVEVTGLDGALAAYYVKAIRFAGIETDATIRVADNPETALEIVLVRGAGSVQGVAESATTVVLAPEQRNRRDLYRTAVPDGAGHFRIDGVAPGNYSLFAWEEELTPGSWFSTEFMRRYEDRGAPVAIAAEGTASAVVTPIPLN